MYLCLLGEEATFNALQTLHDHMQQARKCLVSERLLPLIHLQACCRLGIPLVETSHHLLACFLHDVYRDRVFLLPLCKLLLPVEQHINRQNHQSSSLPQQSAPEDCVQKGHHLQARTQQSCRCDSSKVSKGFVGYSLLLTAVHIAPGLPTCAVANTKLLLGPLCAGAGPKDI